MFEKRLAYAVVVLILLYALYNALMQESTHRSAKTKQQMKTSINIDQKEPYKEELQKLYSNNYMKQYIIHVINHGSEQFNFKGGIMEGGFALPADAPKIACYVMEFSGKKCDTTYEKNAAMFYTSNCAGCHGEDGKGLNGTYPDLTRETFLGIEKREAFLKASIKKMY